MHSQIERNKIYSLKMNSGEEVIAKVLDVNEAFIKVEEPVSIAPGPQGMGLMPTFFTAETNAVTINVDSIALCAETTDSVCAKYIEVTTGLSVPTKKIITG